MPTLSGPEIAAQREELLVHQRLDRARVERSALLGHRLEVHGRGDQRLARAGRRVEDDVLAREELEDRLFLRGVEREPLLAYVGQKAVEHLVLVRVLRARRQREELVGERGFVRHARASLHRAGRRGTSYVAALTARLGSAGHKADRIPPCPRANQRVSCRACPSGSPRKRRTAMASIHREILIEARPDVVWSALRDVGAIHQRLAPGFVTDVRLGEGARTVTFGNGMVARELIVDIDDNARRLVWAVVGGRMTHHNASAQVFEHEGGSRFVWIADLLPHELAPAIASMMEQGLSVIKRTLEVPVVPRP